MLPAQQAVEKYLKAVIALAGSPIPRTHNLKDVQYQCLTVEPALVLDRNELAVLTPYAVQVSSLRGFWPDQATAQEALATVYRVRTTVLSVLASRGASLSGRANRSRPVGVLEDRG